MPLVAHAPCRTILLPRRYQTPLWPERRHAARRLPPPPACSRPGATVRAALTIAERATALGSAPGGAETACLTVSAAS